MINKQRQTHGPLPKVFNYYLIIYLEYAPSGQNTWSQPAQKARALSLRPKWLPPRKWWLPCCPTYFQAAPHLGRGPRTVDQSLNAVRQAPSRLQDLSTSVRPPAFSFSSPPSDQLLPKICFRCTATPGPVVRDYP